MHDFGLLCLSKLLTKIGFRLHPFIEQKSSRTFRLNYTFWVGKLLLQTRWVPCPAAGLGCILHTMLLLSTISQLTAPITWHMFPALWHKIGGCCPACFLLFFSTRTQCLPTVKRRRTELWTSNARILGVPRWIPRPSAENKKKRVWHVWWPCSQQHVVHVK